MSSMVCDSMLLTLLHCKQGLRPTIPKSTNPKLSELLEKCWKQDPNERPEFSEITIILQDILKEVCGLSRISLALM